MEKVKPRDILRENNIPIKTVAAKLEITRHAIYQWDRFPAAHVIPIERITNYQLTRHDMRPDLYPQEEAA